MSEFVQVPTETYERIMASHLQRKLNRAAESVRKMSRALAKQKAQTADDQRYIDLLEARLVPALLAEAREEAGALRRASRAKRECANKGESEFIPRRGGSR